ncbi:hypothetical protein E2C01_096795 [Portunus trituberculatus]|uniref:Uncharacterized protein n=1 Tax=Portunus trituberculatus TaxID=210409 RepID=A0A5B7K2Z5_PORTR|nr:hypothetical protein [Portunus trituberculatus]
MVEDFWWWEGQQGISVVRKHSGVKESSYPLSSLFFFLSPPPPPPPPPPYHQDLRGFVQVTLVVTRPSKPTLDLCSLHDKKGQLRFGLPTSTSPDGGRLEG